MLVNREAVAECVGGALKLSQIGRFEFFDSFAMTAPAMTSSQGREQVGTAVPRDHKLDLIL